jgi:hypothetical protein
VAAFRVADVNHEALQDVELRLHLLVEEVLQVYFCGEGHWVIQLDLCKGLQVKDEPLKMDEQEGRKTMETVVLLDSLHLSFAKITKIVANYLGFDEFVEAIL